MKTIILFSFLLLIFLPAFSQNYNPIAVDGAHWIVRLDQNETIYPVDGLWEYYAKGDTTINTTSYKKIYYRSLAITQNGPPFQSSGLYSLYGFIRDDTTNKKVFAIVLSPSYNCPENQEYLLFDFNLQIGDTANLCIRPTGYYFIVQDILNIAEFGFPTRTFIDYSGDELFEGIGSSYGLFEEMLAPFKKNNEKYIFHTFLYYYCRESPCSILVSNPVPIISSKISIVPNPAKNSFSLIGDKRGEINSIQVFSQLGQVVLSFSGKTEIVDVSQLAKGLYYVRLSTKDNSITEKIVIE